MIIKFDHISYSCQTGEEPVGLLEGFTQEFSETKLPNITAKNSFLKNKAATHNISLYRCEGKYPIEITAYPECDGENRKYDVSDDLIVVYSPDVETTVAFYEAIGFKVTEDKCLELLPFMEQKKVVLQVKEADTDEVFLDKGGFGSLAFVVDRIEKHRTQLEKKAFQVTDVEMLKVNGKELKICFVTDGIGDIVEFIGIR